METSHPREERFQALYEATYVDLLRFVQRRAHPTHAEDVVADAFLVAWRRLDEVPTDSGAARAWLYGVARRVLLNARRGRERQDSLAVRISRARAVPDPSGMDPDLLASRLDLAAAWTRLSATDQEAIALSVWDGLSAPEASVVIGISPVAFRLRLSRARRLLRHHLDVTSVGATVSGGPAAAPHTEGHQ